MSQGKLNILFVRHGETQDNIDRMLQGHRDTDLTPKGHEQAKVLAKQFQGQHIDAIYHSPLKRITQTIQPILDQQPGVPTYADADLKGQYLGELEGGSYDSIDMNNPRSADGGPGVELFNHFVERLKRVFSRILGQEAPKVKDGDRTVVIATHGVGITSLFKTLENSPSCDGFNRKLAHRGPEAYEVRWTDSDDVAKIVVDRPDKIVVRDAGIDWDLMLDEPFLIEKWGKKETSLKQGYMK